MRRNIQVALWLASAIILLGTACATGESPKEAPEVAEKPQAIAGEEQQEEPAPPEAEDVAAIELLEQGEQPRQPLRLSLQPRKTETAEMTIEMQLAMTLDGKPMPTPKMPPLMVRMEAEVGGKTENGNMVRSTILSMTAADSIESNPEIVTAINESLSKVAGLVLEGAISERGLWSNIELADGTQVDPQVGQALESAKQGLSQLGSAFPEEPVGVGAKWEVVQTVVHSGMKMAQRTLYELVERRGDNVLLSFEIKQDADRQTLESPTMSPGHRAELLSYSGSGAGKSEVDLRSPWPQQSTVKTEGTMKVASEVEGRTMDVQAEIAMEATLERAEPEREETPGKQDAPESSESPEPDEPGGEPATKPEPSQQP